MACAAGSFEVRDLEGIIININSVFSKFVKNDVDLILKLGINEKSWIKINPLHTTLRVIIEILSVATVKGIFS